jgi:hypothetical protein
VSDLKRTDDVPADFELEATRLSDLVVNPVLDGMIRLAAGLISILVGLVLLIACANPPASCWRRRRIGSVRSPRAWRWRSAFAHREAASRSRLRLRS